MNIIKSSITKWDIKNINFTYQYDIIDFPYSDIQFFLLKYLLIIKKNLELDYRWYYWLFLFSKKNILKKTINLDYCI